LTYSTGKAQSEKDIIESGKTYVILRLASVYGYSTDTMRIGIMPNLFSKIASQNGTIKLFSGGVQIKSLVPLMDVARCMKFMEENSHVDNQVYHVSKDFVTVKDVANICKTINPKVTIVETKDEIPNLGYTISNAKLLATGFIFRHSLEESIREMITNWSTKDINPDLEYLDKGGKVFRDGRGVIRNYELTEPINLIGYIESVAGSVRANHYHPIQEQKCLLVSGQYVSVIKDLSYPNAPIETRVVNPGDIAIIKPNVAHAMVFTQDSVFLNLVRGEREHENYGVTHTIPYTLVDGNLRDTILLNYKLSCRGCKRTGLKPVVSLGESPLANNLKNSTKEKEDFYPLQMDYCEHCHNCQLSVVVPPTLMFDNYLYVSSTTSSFRKHFDDAVERYVKEFNLTPESLVIDIGSNDGIALRKFKELGIDVLGIEPAKNLADMANKEGIPTANEYLEKFVKYAHKSLGADLITATNVFAHTDTIDEFVNGVKFLLSPTGTFIVEVQYLLNTIQDLTFDNIYHEHVNYWSVTSLKSFFERMGMTVYKVEAINTHGGSIRVFTSQDPGVVVDSSVQTFLDNEKNNGLLNFSTYKEFGARIEATKEVVLRNIRKLKETYPVLAGYGSPAKATTSLNYFGVNSSFIDYTIEDNALKHGKVIPGVDIPIVSKQYCKEHLPNAIIVFAWNFFDHIKKNNQELIDSGVRFINLADLKDPNFVV